MTYHEISMNLGWECPRKCHGFLHIGGKFRHYKTPGGYVTCVGNGDPVPAGYTPTKAQTDADKFLEKKPESA